MRVRAIATIIVLGAFMAAGGCGGQSSPPSASRATPTSSSPSPTPEPTSTTVDLQPVLEIKPGPSYSPNWVKTKAGCRGTGGYDDLRKGEGVTLYGPNGDVVGTGFVTLSVILEKRCVLIATVSNASRVKFYKVQFGSRDSLAFSIKEMQDKSAVTIVG